MHSSITYWRGAAILGGVTLVASILDACSTNASLGYDAPGAPDASDASDAAEVSASCGLLNRPCCANASCTEPGTFCSSGAICKSDHPADVGSHCATGANCMSGLCTDLLGNDPMQSAVCSQPCNETKDCVAGWSCSVGGHGMRGTCVCAPAAETCDGIDNDCNGKVDDAPAADDDCTLRARIPQKCVDGQCSCATTCDGRCIDATTDMANCGACGHACNEGAQLCVGSQCVCAGSLCPVPDGGIVGDAGYIIPDGGDGGTPLACVQTLSDTENCGGCGIKCNYACSYGGCVPKSLVSLAATPERGGIAAAGANVVIMTDAEGGVLETCAIAGCNGHAAEVASGLHNTNNAGSVGHLATGGGWVYWAEQTSVRSMTIAGTAPQVFAQPANAAVVAVATNSRNVFWTDANLGIATCAFGATCASPTTLLASASLAAAPRGIVADETYVYWTDAAGNLSSYPIAGGSQAILATGFGDVAPVAMAAVAGRVYFAEPFDPDGVSNSNVRTATGGSASSSTFYYGNAFAPGGGVLLAIATDGTSLYWSDGRQIFRCAAGVSCATATVLWGGVHAQSLAVDANNLYWLSTDTNQGASAAWEFHK